VHPRSPLKFGTEIPLSECETPLAHGPILNRAAKADVGIQDNIRRSIERVDYPRRFESGVTVVEQRSSDEGILKQASSVRRMGAFCVDCPRDCRRAERGRDGCANRKGVDPPVSSCRDRKYLPMCGPLARAHRAAHGSRPMPTQWALVTWRVSRGPVGTSQGWQTCNPIWPPSAWRFSRKPCRMPRGPSCFGVLQRPHTILIEPASKTPPQWHISILEISICRSFVELVHVPTSTPTGSKVLESVTARSGRPTIGAISAPSLNGNTSRRSGRKLSLTVMSAAFRVF
jgi:hypothetical protein